MMKKLLILVLLLIIPVSSNAVVLFEDNFNSQADWTIQQPTGSDNYCYDFYGTNCGTILPGWSGYYNGANYCDGSSDEPGHNNFYVNASPGYPDVTTNTSRGGSGKSVTYWQESCSSIFQNSDGQLTKLLPGEYDEIYLQFWIRFKPGFELKDTGTSDMFQFKLFHIQSYYDGSPHAYFENGEVHDRPIVSGGLEAYGQNLQFYAVARCVGTYSCHGDILWSISTITQARQSGGILDGGWHCIEIYAQLNSAVGSYDGEVRAYIDGSVLNYVSGYEGNDIQFNDSAGTTQKFRYITVGGNSWNQWDTSCSNTADCEQWYAIDDVGVSTTYIGTDHVIGVTYAPPTINAGSDQTVYASTATINGTYTVDSRLSVDVCSWSHGIYSGFCVTYLGVISGTVTDLAEGANTVTIELFDSVRRSDSDTVVFTRSTANITLTGGIYGHGGLNNATIH